MSNVRRILIVDDDNELRETLAEQLALHEEFEPLAADSPLWDAPNLVVTPHMAGASSEKERRCVEILRENLIRFHNGDPLLNLVDKRLGY